MSTKTLRGTLTRLAERVTTPLLPNDYLDVIDPLLSGDRGRVVGIHPETRDAATLAIKPGKGWRPHTPGQYLRLGVEVNGVRHWRAYSLTSRTSDGCVAVTVKAVPGGAVSNHLVRRCTLGAIVHLDQPAGEFTLGTPAPDKILFVTAGSGITPIMGMLRNLGPDEAPDITVVHSAPNAENVIFGGELRMLASRKRIRLVEVHTDTHGRLDMARLSSLVDDLGQRQTWACGPASLLDDIELHWAAIGLADQLHTERFRSSFIATGDGGAVTFSNTGTKVEAAGTQSLLHAGESAGVLMPSGCRMGICFGCVAPLRSGAVRDLRTGETTIAGDGDGVIVQTCISGAAGDCDIAL